MRLLLILIISLAFQSNAQQTKDLNSRILSAEKKLEKIKNSKADSVYIDSLISIGKSFLNDDLTFSKQCLTQAIDLSLSKFGEMDNRYLEAMHQYAIMLNFSNDLIGSKTINEKTLNLRLKKFPNGNIDVLRSKNNLALNYGYLGNENEYETIMWEVIDTLIHTTLYHSKFCPTAFGHFSNYMENQNRYEEAEMLLFELAKIQSSKNDFLGLAETNLNIGKLYNKLGDDLKAIENFKVSIEIVEKHNILDEELTKKQLDKLANSLINVNRFNDAKIVLEELEKVSKKDVFYLSTAYCGLTLTSKINGNEVQYEKYIKLLDKEYAQNNKLNTTDYAEAYLYLGLLFGIQNFDKEALNFMSIGYNIYRTTPDSSSMRFNTVALRYATSLQNTGNYKKAIEIYEDLKSKASIEFLNSNSFYTLCMNLAGSYSNVKDLVKATSVREEGFQFYFRHHISDYWDERAEKEREKQLRDLQALGKHLEMKSCLEEFKSFYASINDTLRQVDCLTELSSVLINNFYNLKSAKEYLDTANFLVKNKQTILLQHANIKYLEAEILRRQGIEDESQLMLITSAFSIYKKIGNYDLMLFKFCAYRLATMQLRNGEKSKAIKTYEDFTDSLCKMTGGNSFDCLNSTLKEIEFLSEILEIDSLRLLIDSVNSQYANSFEEQVDNKIILNTLKLRTYKDGSLEARMLILENIGLLEKNLDIQNLLHWKAKLALNYFNSDSTQNGKVVWEEIFTLIDQYNLDELKYSYKKQYAWQLSEYNIDINLAILIYENETSIINDKQFESYDNLIDVYLKVNELEKAKMLLLEKEHFIKSKPGNEEELFRFYYRKIKYYELQGDKKNVLQLNEERFSLLEKFDSKNSSEMSTILGNLCMLYIELGNSKKAVDLITDKIQYFGWDLNPLKKFDNLRDSTFDFILLHYYKNTALFNWCMINNDTKSLNYIISDYKFLIKFTEEWNPNYSNIISKSIVKELLSFSINIVDMFIGNDINQKENDYKLLIDEYNKIKISNPDLAEILKFQIIFLLDYFEKDYELYNFSIENKTPLDVSFFERKGFFIEADSINFNRIKSEISDLNKTKFILSEDEQLNYKAKLNWSLNNDLLSFVEKIHFSDSINPKYKLHTENPNNHRKTKIKSSEVYELVLNTSGSILENKKKLNKAISERSELKFLVDKWKELNLILNNQELNDNKIAILKDSISIIERKMFQESGLTGQTWLSFNDVKTRLMDDELIVHTKRIFGSDDMNRLNSDSIIYLHFVIDKQLQEPIIFVQKMNQEQEIEMANNFKYYTQGKGKNEKDVYSYKDLFGFLNENNLLKKKKKIIHIPDGIYHEINLATIYIPSINKYMASEFQINIFDMVGKMEEPIIENTQNVKTAILVGSPDFDLAASNENDSPQISAESQIIDSLTRGGLIVMPLPATKKEIEKVSENLIKNDWNVTQFTGKSASETLLKNIHQPSVLHIASHGYFLEDVSIQTKDNTYMGINRDRLLEDPMLRSGLLLAGANKSLKEADKSDNNGIFSAFEASLLDLEKTELVVLSACQTGKGEIKNSEGVYGLRKAFADAGAKNVIMSLWKVDDKATQEFMTRFYEIWLNEKTTIREAFNKTQLEIMMKYPQPYYWGAFILVEN